MRGVNTHLIEGDIVYLAIKDKVCTIDLADLELISQYWWYLDSYGYAYTCTGSGTTRKSMKMHRMILDFPVASDVDHADRNKLNNCRSNLRLATRSQNCANIGLRANNTSGYKGVSWHGRSNKWTANIGINGKQVFIGNFDTPEEAHEAYKAKALETFGKFSCNG